MAPSLRRIARDLAAAMTGKSITSLLLPSVVLACAACSGGPALPELPTGSLAPGLSSLASVTLAGEPSQLPHPSAELYSRIARGANRCWFGAHGRIASTHMLHADADSSAVGGRVEIVVHERASDQPKPWGYKAFRIMLAEGAGLGGSASVSTSIAVENARLPDAEARRMRSEVFQWAKGEEGCKADPALDKPREADAPVMSEVPVKSKSSAARPKAGAARGHTAAAKSSR